jgi:hypothetical protein
MRRRRRLVRRLFVLVRGRPVLVRGPPARLVRASTLAPAEMWLSPAATGSVDRGQRDARGGGEQPRRRDGGLPPRSLRLGGHAWCEPARAP